MSEAISIALLVSVIGGFGTLYFKMGRLEKTVNGSIRDFNALKSHCPLCKQLGLTRENETPIGTPNI